MCLILFLSKFGCAWKRFAASSHKNMSCDDAKKNTLFSVSYVDVPRKISNIARLDTSCLSSFLASPMKSSSHIHNDIQLHIQCLDLFFVLLPNSVEFLVRMALRLR